MKKQLDYRFLLFAIIFSASLPLAFVLPLWLIAHASLSAKVTITSLLYLSFFLYVVVPGIRDGDFWKK